MAYASSTAYLLTRLKKKFCNYESRGEWPHAGLYGYNGRQMGLFHMEWFNCGWINGAYNYSPDIWD